MQEPPIRIVLWDLKGDGKGRARLRLHAWVADEQKGSLTPFFSFLQEKVARPVGKAGEATGKAVKRGASWVWDRLKGDQGN